MAYSEDFISNALALLASNEGKVKPTAESIGVDPRTVRRWRDTIASGKTSIGVGRQKSLQKKKALVDLWEDLAHRAIGAIDESKLKTSTAKDLATITGISTEKMRLLRGESTEITERKAWEVVEPPQVKARTNGHAVES